ncbi:MAG: cytochrome b N-terminal domain-containing protein [Acidobacteria bacterium]|nr:cytochrome b N-terminal domain-containing protein [Acidobacteriota bacterium]
MIRRVVEWLEHRTGVETAIRNFLYEEIPASSGWRQVFGSVAVFCFLVQAFTGILLAFNYAPTPGEAYNSLKYIVTEVAGGRLIRGLHHWGASLMIVVVALHMAQVFLWGAYKKPREATWIAGVVLLLITLGYGLTGYLLPWDNRAYWGTVVATQIAAKSPGIGAYLSRLLGGEGAIGVVTFARFFALHVLILPPLTALLIGIHVCLVRKHGVTPAAGDTAPKKKFYPEQVFRDTVAIFVSFALLFLMAALVQVPLDRLADPTDTSYIPRPDWYFLWLFQLLKVFEGPLEVVGTHVLPGLAVLALVLAPFLDRGALRRVRERTLAGGLLVLAVLGLGGLTAAAVATSPKSPEAVSGDGGPREWQQLSPEELAGIGYFRTESCASCHTGGGTAVGPDLTATATRKSAAWMIAHFKTPQRLMPGTSMPPIQLTDAQLNALAAFLLKLNPRNAQALASAPQFAVEGAMVYQQYQCAACHQVNGAGMKLGPSLNGLEKRRSRDWLAAHFANPQALSPGSVMPPYKFPPRELERLTTYLLSLPE